MKTKFQGGGSIVDEDELFNDNDTATQKKPIAGPLDGEIVDTGDTEVAEDDVINQDLIDSAAADAAAATAIATAVELTGVEQFLTAYGVQGGVITYEDGATARFVDLSPEEQNNILSSLVQESTPSIEEKYNLDDDEVNLLNVLRDSNMTSEEFINSLVDFRMQAVAAQRELGTTDYTKVSDDGIFVKNLKDADPEITDEEIAVELDKAKELSSYKATTDAMRKLFINEQADINHRTTEERNQIFTQELEAQRYDIVGAIENINDIAGARISPEMKEYLLHDIMELNENKDPILMEKLFSSPEAMFKANWFNQYGEDYMREQSNYWKKEVSKARKEGYLQATGGMPGNPISLGGVDRKTGAPLIPGTVSFGRELSEEELFDQAEN